MTEPLTFRSSILQIVPRWLQGFIGGRLLYSFGLVLDGFFDLTSDGIKARFPGHSRQADDSLALVGNERRIRRGPNEARDIYASRLLTWWDDHKHRGGPYALISQVARFWQTTPGVDAFHFDLVYESGQAFRRVLNATFGPQDGVPALSSPYDSDTTHWARWWLVFDWPNTISDDGLWSDPGTWDDSGTWDTNLTEAQVAEVRLVPAEWNNAHCQGHVVLLSNGAELWDIPSGTWNDPGVWGGTGNSLTVAVD